MTTHMTRAGLALAISALLAGCGGDRPSATRAYAVLSDARSDGAPGFFFLPPVARQPDGEPANDAGLSPVVEVASLGTGAALLVRFEGDEVKESGSHYMALWSTKRHVPLAGTTYRISVLLDGTVLGFADAQVASDGRELRLLASDEIFGLTGNRTLPIKFRIRQVPTDPCDGVACEPPSACQASNACDPELASCVATAQPPGTTCDDGNGCTTGDACDAQGACAGTAIACPAPAQCQQSLACDPAVGACVAVNQPQGTACDDGSGCTTGDACDGQGACHGAAVACPAPTQCQATVACDPELGACVAANQPAGASCEDGNFCTSGDRCDGEGACLGGGSPCAASDPAAGAANAQCNPLERCDSTAGQCVYRHLRQTACTASVGGRPVGGFCSPGSAGYSVCVPLPPSKLAR